MPTLGGVVLVDPATGEPYKAATTEEVASQLADPNSELGAALSSTYATVAQGAKADTAVQPDALAAAVATTTAQIGVAIAGHAAPMVSGMFYVAEGATITTGTSTDGTMRGGVLVVGRDSTLTEIGVEVTTAGAGSTYRLGIYRISDVTPGCADLLMDAGTVNSTTIGYKSLVINVPVTRGDRLLLVGTPQGGTPPTVRSTSGPVPLFGNTTGLSIIGGAFVGSVLSGVNGALPATYVFTSGSGSSVPRIAVKAA